MNAYFNVYRVYYTKELVGVIFSETMFIGGHSQPTVDSGREEALKPVCHLVKDIEFVLAEKRDGVDVYSIK